MKLRQLQGLKISALVLLSFIILQTVQADEADETLEAIEEGTNYNILNSNYSFSNVSINFLDWTDGTKDRSGKKEFLYLELEGGAGWDWGDFYFFADIENPGKTWDGDNAPDNRRFVFKPIVDIRLGDSNWHIHVQDYYLKEDDFYVNNFVPGISYKYVKDGLFLKPFIGAHYQNSHATHFSTHSGWNGFMAGWVAAYDFDFKGQDLTVSQWHENEFDRDRDHYKPKNDAGVRVNSGDGASHGTNGAIALWWHVNKKITTGIQYRYANHKLGSYAYQTGPIYTVKYNF